jgi:hypothetical protein
MAQSSVISSRINFVGLTGPEKCASLPNVGLRALQSVIVGLNQLKPHIPFRDSI